MYVYEKIKYSVGVDLYMRFAILQLLTTIFQVNIIGASSEK